MRIDDDALLQSVHNGVFETPLWYDCMSRLAAKSGAHCAALLFRSGEDQAAEEIFAGQPPPAELHTKLIGFEMRPNRVYALEELAGMDAHGPFALNSHLTVSPALSHMRAIRIKEFGGVDLWLSCWGGRDIGSSTGALLSSLAPHFAIALRTFVTLEQERFRSSVTGEAFDRLKMGWLTLDAQCRVLDATTNVEQLFQWGMLLKRGRYNRLVPASPIFDRQITALVKQFSSDKDARPQAFNLNRDPWVDMLVAPYQGKTFSGSSAPVAVAYVSGDRRSQADRCEQLVDLFGLLPSEARLAWMLAQATSIADSAQALGITVETARNYSKKIYAKTGARGQAELVRTIMTSVLAFS